MKTFLEIQDSVKEKLKTSLAEIEIEEAGLNDRLRHLSAARHDVVAQLHDMDEHCPHTSCSNLGCNSCYRDFS